MNVFHKMSRTILLKNNRSRLSPGWLVSVEAVKAAVIVAIITVITLVHSVLQQSRSPLL